MRISIYPPLFIHEIGQRTNQEDSIIQWNNRLFVLCDGMGGHEKGEVASQTICRSLVKWFEENIKDDSFSDDQLHAALEYAYSELDKFDDGSPRKMGTTLTLLYLHRQGVTAAHIGDSRIYHIRPQGSSPSGRLGGAVLYQSRDHSLVFDLFQAGEITYEEMATSPQKNVITRAVTPGEENRHRPDIIHITNVLPGDYFYMCSDGMLEQMTNNELLALFSADAPDKKKRSELIKETVNNKDNHSAWLIHVKNVNLEEGDDKLVNEEPEARCNAVNIIPANNVFSDSLSDNNDTGRAVIGNEDDVKVVGYARDNQIARSPQKAQSQKKPRLFWLLLFIAVLFFLCVWAFSHLMGNKSNSDSPQPEVPEKVLNNEELDSQRQHPITHQAVEPSRSTPSPRSKPNNTQPEKPSPRVVNSSSTKSDKVDAKERNIAPQQQDEKVDNPAEPENNHGQNKKSNEKLNRIKQVYNEKNKDNQPGSEINNE